MSPSSRIAQKEDVASLLKIINEAYRSDGGWTNEHKLVKHDRISHDSLLETIQTGALIVAIIDTNIVGCICVEDLDVKDKPHVVGPLNESCTFGLFAVSPQKQGAQPDSHVGQGIGGFLFERALVFAKSICKTYSLLKVLECREELLRWYFKLGFKEIENLKCDFPAPHLLLVEGLKFKVLVRPVQQ